MIALVSMSGNKSVSRFHEHRASVQADGEISDAVLWVLPTKLSEPSKRMIQVLLLLVSALLCAGVKAEAKPVLTATCEPPTGPRIDYGDEKIGTRSEPKLKVQEDSFTGITPIFIVNDDETMTVVWGGTKVQGVPEEMSAPSAMEAKIIYRSDEQITALEIVSGGIWVYSLYPELEYGVFTRQVHWMLGKHLIGTLFHSKCAFKR